jgi:hypothetical protein
MSSHHFVKEGQEPALILASPFQLRDIGMLLEWVPLVITLPPAVDSLLASGVKTDVLVTDTSGVAEISKVTDHQAPVEVITAAHPRQPVEAALLYLASRKHSDVNIWTASAPVIFDVVEPYVGQLAISLIDRQARWSAIRTKFTKWLPEKSVLHVRSKTEIDISGVQTQRTENVVVMLESGMVEIRSADPFWLSENL